MSHQMVVKLRPGQLWLRSCLRRIMGKMCLKGLRPLTTALSKAAEMWHLSPPHKVNSHRPTWELGLRHPQMMDWT